MAPKSIVTHLLLIGCLLHSASGSDSNGQQQGCLDGDYHKKSPSAETVQLHHCQPWNKLSCCTANYTNELASNGTRATYLHGYHRCGRLSQQCMQFWIAQKCFYQCSPYLFHWKNADHKGSLKGAPICTDYCNDWFSACKDDVICLSDPLQKYNISVVGQDFCPSNHSDCATYATTFSDGAGLCNKLWGTAYVNQKPNLNRSNCMVMQFNGSNPNAAVTFTATTAVAPTVGEAALVNSPAALWFAIIGIFAPVVV